ncbi:MAG: hypothetical protein ABIH21_03825, partial [Patescibacteria group bacterium]
KLGASFRNSFPPSSKHRERPLFIINPMTYQTWNPAKPIKAKWPLLPLHILVIFMFFIWCIRIFFMFLSAILPFLPYIILGGVIAWSASEIASVLP